MKKIIASFVLFFGLVGCGSTITTKTETIKVPVPVACQVEPIYKPRFELENTPTTVNLFEKTRAALVEIEQRKVYESELEVALDTCRRKL